MTRLRKMMLEELQCRNYSESTIRGYLRTVAEFARHFGKSPDKLSPDDLRSYQAYLLQERKLTVGTVIDNVSGLSRGVSRWKVWPIAQPSENRWRLRGSAREPPFSLVSEKSPLVHAPAS